MSIQFTRRALALFAILAVLNALAILLSAPPAHATTLCVNPGGTGGCFSTITAALSAASSDDTINVDVGAYAENLSINKNVTINGAGAASTKIDGGQLDRVISIPSGVSVTIANVTIQNGKAASGGNGGGILNSGVMSITNSMIISNTADTGSGGGIRNDGSATLINVTVSGNHATTTQGGGIVNTASLTLTHSAVAGNTAGDLGGGIYNQGAVTFTTNVTISANSAATGGGIFNDTTGTVTINNSAIISNTSGAYAGGVANKGTFTLTNVTVSGNHAALNGGGVGNETTLTLINVSVSNNTSDNGAGSGVYNFSGTQTLKNTLVADNAGANCSGAITSAGHNLDSANTCGFTALGDLVNSNPLLGPLQDNGGATLTRALSPGSPAIDAGDNNGCPATDQRGIARPQGLRCDIGAYEAQTSASFRLYLPLIMR